MAPGRVLAITGPTAVGKSALALAVAEHLGGEIVSADSRQVYRGLDVGTAKPTAAERARVPHHFVDQRAPGDRLASPSPAGFSAGQFAREAEDRIAEIHRRGRAPVVVGGSLLYLDALVRGIADLPPLSTEDRDTLSELARTPDGRRSLFDELQAADPEAAATLDETKTHRLVRLVGVLRRYGPPSALWKSAPPPRFTYRVVVLYRPREDLYARIDRRVEAMVAGGLVEEVRGLLAQGVVLDRGPLRTIGYAEPAAFLRGELSHDEMVRSIQQNTRRFAKRQLTWLRNRYADAEWFAAETATVRTVVGSK